jgi:hypothetical protein
MAGLVAFFFFFWNPLSVPLSLCILVKLELLPQLAVEFFIK